MGDFAAGYRQENVREQANLAYNEILKVCNQRVESKQAITTMENLLQIFPQCDNADIEVILKSFIGTLASTLLPQYNLKITMLYVELLMKYYQILHHQPSNHCGRNCSDCAKVQTLQNKNNLDKYRDLILKFACLNLGFNSKPSLPQILYKNPNAIDLKFKDQPFDINHFLLMLSNRILSGANITQILKFLLICLNYILQSPNPLPRAEITAHHALLRLILDPLVVLNVKNNPNINLQFKGKSSIPLLPTMNTQLIEVVWTDKFTDSFQNYLPPRDNGMEVFKKLLLLCTPSEFRAHLETLAQMCSDECYATDPYSHHIATRLPEILEIIISSGKWRYLDEQGWSPLPLLFNVLTQFQENAEVRKHNFTFNILKTVLSLVFKVEAPLENSSLLWDALLEFILAGIRYNFFTSDQLVDCSNLCLQTLVEVQSEIKSSNNLPWKYFLSDIVYLGVVLCFLLVNSRILNRSTNIELPIEVVWFYLEFADELKSVNCSQFMKISIVELIQSTTDPSLTVAKDHTSTKLSFLFLNYLQQTTNLNLINLFLTKVTKKPSTYPHEIIYFALKVMRCEAADYLFVNKLTTIDLLNLLELLYSCGGLEGATPNWELCQLAFDLLYVIFCPGCPEKTQAVLREVLSSALFDKFELILEKALIESTNTAISILMVYIRSILFFNFCFQDFPKFVKEMVQKHGSFLLKYSASIFSLKSTNEPFSHFLLLIKHIMVPPQDFHGLDMKEEQMISISSYLLGMFFSEYDEGFISDDTVFDLIADLLNQFKYQDNSRSLKPLLNPYLSDLLRLASRSSHPQLQVVVVHVLGHLLEFSNEENEIIQNSYKHGEQIQFKNPDFAETFTFNSKDLDYFSGKIRFDLQEKSIGSDMIISDWEKLLKALKISTPFKNPEVNFHQPNELGDSTKSLVITPTTLINVARVKSAAATKTPLLLQGPAGVGKTATITEAALQSGNFKPLIRVNLSPQTQIDDLIGKMMLVPGKEKNQKETLQFVPYPFTIAFRDGHWLLLDELNLAPDNVLQALESAIDREILILPDITAGEEFPSRYVNMNPNFRIFATQNPHSGFFKNAREKLSVSFLDRFSPVNFEELPENEWNPIIESKLKERGIDDHSLAVQLSVTIVRHHIALSKLFRGPTFPERTSYSDASIRELLKVVDHLAAHYRCQPDLLNQTSTLKSLVGFELWSIYGARFRGSGRNEFSNLLSHLNYSYVNVPASWDITPHSIVMDEIHRDFIPTPKVFMNSKTPSKLLDKISKIDEEIMNLIYNKTFIIKHGVYLLARSWISNWLQQYHSEKSETQFLEDGCILYFQKFIHLEAQQSILEIFKKYSIAPSPAILNSRKSLPEKSFTVTQNTLSIWKQLAASTLAQDPLRPESFLLVGKDGCGKSDCIRAFAAVVGRNLDELCVLPETEPSAFIGQFLPNDDISPTNESRVVWVNGAITEAFQNGSWLLIDNFSQAEPSVLERLNPILEQPPILTLVEAGRSTLETLHPGYCVFATMTPPIAGGGEGQGSELSPALNNRFTVIAMDNICETNDETFFSSEIMKICQNNLPESWNIVQPGDTQSACQLLTTLSWMILKKKVLPTFTLRNICRMVDFAFSLSLAFPDSSMATRIWTAFSMTVRAQILPSRKFEGDELVDEVQKLLKTFDPNWEPFIPDFIASKFGQNQNQSEYVLTKSRKIYAQIILACISCRVSVLLEGGAATGKTTLVLAMAKWRNKKVERVNNTYSTTIQDYLGCYLPDGKGFVFKKGPLYRAMEKGHWFLADEFNLADPSVMNLLVPLLEGKTSLKVPGSNKEIPLHPEFRFFATQNGSQYANRKKLPTGLRNRFVEIQFEDFPADELAEIIRSFKEPNQRDDSSHLFEDQNINIPLKIAQLYHELKGLGSLHQITMRQIVKWIRRHKTFVKTQTISWGRIGFSLLSTSYSLSQSSECQKLLSTMVKVGLLDDNEENMLFEQWKNPDESADIRPNNNKNGLIFSEGNTNVELIGMCLDSEAIFPLSVKQALVRMAIAVKHQEPILLVGDSSFKSYIMKLWFRMHERNMRDFPPPRVLINLRAETESSDLLGEIRPFTFTDLLLQLRNGSLELRERMISLWNSMSDDFQNQPERSQDYRELNRQLGFIIPTLVAELLQKWRLFLLQQAKNEQSEEIIEILGDHLDLVEEVKDVGPSPEINDFFGESNLSGNYQETLEMINDHLPVNNSSQQFTLPSEFLPEGLIFKQLTRCRQFMSRVCNSCLLDRDAASELMIKKLFDLLETCRKCANHPENPAFLFQDGPITRAAKMGIEVYLEDFDSPSAAVIERLNSMLETNPTLSISEDITVSRNNITSEDIVESDDTTIHLLPSFQVFATLHLSHGQSLSSDVISPATKSRFTVIHCSRYSDEELNAIVRESLKRNLPEQEHPLIDKTIQFIFEFRKEMFSLLEFPTDIHHIFRVVEFICHHSSQNCDILKRTMLALRFFYADELEESKLSELITRFWRRVGGSEICPYLKYFEPIALHTSTEPFLWDSNEVVLSYCDVRSEVHPDMTEDKMQMCLRESKMNPTITMLMNSSRIFAAIAARAPLLLIGPPGVGKTAGVLLVCSILGFQCERINLSGNTTVDSLIGSIIPTMENGVRVFKWHAGVLVRALTEKKWILFDEINLTPPEVLDCLTPLLSRDRTFTLPLTGEVINISESRIFATMNPSSIGGNRSQLPRSVKNLFSSVLLSPFANEELKFIFQSSCSYLISTGILNSSLVETFFKIHLKVQEAVRERKVGLKGGPFEFNLRTLLQLTTTLEENASDRQFFLTAQNSGAENSESNSTSDLQSLALCSLVDMIYSSPFQSVEEQQFIRSLIVKEMKLSEEALEEKVTIDSSGEQFTRIGAVYLRKGSMQKEPRRSPLFETPGLCRQLQILASGAQCSRPVLLEGDTCSAKTSLILDLAHRCNQELVIISLNQDTETSDLIGQWIPLQLNSTTRPDYHRIEQPFHEAIKFLVVHITSFLKLEPPELILTIPSGELSVDDFISSVFEITGKATQVYTQGIVLEGEEMDPHDELLQDSDGWKNYCDLMTMKILSKILFSCTQCDQLTTLRRTSFRLYSKCSHLIERLSLYDKENRKLVRMREFRTSGSNETSFIFNPTPLIDAIESGKWVLFDNLNSAPPEVIERLNSLFEDPPFLSLYEKSEGAVYTKSDIHPNFRIFCTANVGRIHSNKLSSALLNRCLRIWLPTLDRGLTFHSDSQLTNHDLYHLLMQKFSGLSGARDLAKVFVLFHRECKKKVESKSILPMDGFQLTARTLLRAADCFANAVQRSKDFNTSIAELSCWSLLKTYGALLTTSGDSNQFKNILADIVDSVISTKPPFDRYFIPQQDIPKYETDAQELIYPHISSIEIQFGNIIFAALSFGIHLRSQMASFIGVFLEYYLIPQAGEGQLFSEALEKSRRYTLVCESKDIENLLQEIQDTCVQTPALQSLQLHLICNHSSVQKQQELIEWIRNCFEIFQSSIRRLKDGIFQYLNETSVMDCSSRLELMERLFQIISMLTSLISLSTLNLQTNPEINEIVLLLKNELSLLGKFSHLNVPLPEMNTTMSTMIPELNSSTLSSSKNRGVVWAYHNESSHPVTSPNTRRRMRQFAESLLSGNHSLHSPSIIKFQMASDLHGILFQSFLLKSRPLLSNQNITFSKKSLYFLEIRAVLSRVIVRYLDTIDKNTPPTEVPRDDDSNNILDLQNEIKRTESFLSSYERRLESLLADFPSFQEECNHDNNDDLSRPPSLERLTSVNSHQLEELLAKIGDTILEYKDNFENSLAIPVLHKQFEIQISEARRGLTTIAASIDQQKTKLLKLIKERDEKLMEIERSSDLFTSQLSKLEKDLQLITESQDYQILLKSSSQYQIEIQQQYLKGLKEKSNLKLKSNKISHTRKIPISLAGSLIKEHMNLCSDADPYTSIASLTLIKNKLSYIWIIPLLFSDLQNQSFYLFSSFTVNEDVKTLVNTIETLPERTSIFVYDPQMDTLSAVVIDRVENNSSDISFWFYWLTDSIEMLPWQKIISDFLLNAGVVSVSRLFYSIDYFPEEIENQSSIAPFILTVLTVALLPFSDDDTDDIPTREDLKHICTTVIGTVESVSSEIHRLLGSPTTKKNFDSDREVFSLISSILSLIVETQRLVQESRENLSSKKLISLFSSNSYQYLSTQKINNFTMLEAGKKQLSNQCKQSIVDLFELYSVISTSDRSWPVGKEIFRECQVENIFEQLIVRRQFRDASVATTKVITFFLKYISQKMKDPNEVSRLWLFHNQIVTFLESLVTDILMKTVQLVDDKIHVDNPRSKEWFESKQSTLNNLIENLQVPTHLIRSSQLDQLFIGLEICGDFVESFGESESKESNPLSSRVDVNYNQQFETLQNIYHRIESIMAQARSIKPLPNAILVDLRSLLIRIKTAQKTCDLDIVQLRQYEREPAKFERLLQEYSAMLVESDPFLAKIKYLANQKQIPEITQDLLAIAPDCDQIHDSLTLREKEDFVKLIVPLKRLLDESINTTVEHEILKNLVVGNTKVASWKLLLKLTHLMMELITSGSDPDQILPISDQISALLVILYDSLSLKIETLGFRQLCNDAVEGNSVAKDKLNQILEDIAMPNVIRHFGEHRQQLLLDSDSSHLINNYTLIQDECQLGRLMISSKQPTLGNLFPLLNSLHTRSQTLLQELRCCIKGTSCLLLPLSFELTDLISLFIPSQTEAFGTIHLISETLSGALRSGNAEMLGSWSVNSYSLQQITEPKENVFADDIRSFDFLSYPNLFNPTFCQEFLEKISNCYSTIFSTLQGFLFSSSSRVSNIWSHLEDCFPLQLSISLSILYLMEGALSHVISNDKLLPKLSMSKNRVDDEEYRNKLNEMNRRLGNYRQSLKLKLDEKSSLENSIIKIKGEIQGHEMRLKMSHISSIIRSQYQDKIQVCRSSLQRHEFKLHEVEEIIKNLQLDINNAENELQTLQNIYENEKLNLVSKVRGEINELLTSVSLFCGDVVRFLLQGYRVHISSSFSGNISGRFQTHLGGDDEAAKTEINHEIREWQLDVIHGLLNSLLNLSITSTQNPSQFTFDCLTLDPTLQSITNSSKRIRQNIFEDDPFNRLLQWSEHLIVNTYHSISSFCSQWPKYHSFISRNSQSSVNWTKKLYSLSQVTEENVNLLEISIRRRVYFSKISEHHIPTLIAYLDQIYDLCLSFGIDEADGLFMSFNSTAAFLASVVICTAKLLKIQGHVVYLTAIELAVKSKLKKLSDCRNNNSSHLLNIDPLWNSLDEGELLQRFSLLMLFLPSVVTSLTHFVTHGAFCYLTSPFSLVEEIQGTLEYYSRNCLAPAYLCHRMIESFATLTPIFYSSSVQESLTLPLNLPNNDSDILYLFDSRHRHPLIHAPTVNFPRPCGYCGEKITDSHFASCLSASCDSVFHVQCLQFENVINENVSKEEIQIFHTLLSTFYRIANFKLITEDQTQLANFFTFDEILLRKDNDLCLAKEVDNFVNSSLEFLALLSHRRPQLESILTEFDKSIVVLQREITRSSVQSLSERWKDFVHLHCESTVEMEGNILQCVDNQTVTLDLKQITLVDVFQMDNLLQRYYRDIQHFGMEGAHTTEILRPTERFHLLANLLYNSFLDEGQILQVLVSCSPELIGLSDVLRGYLSHFTHSKILMKLSLSEIENSKDAGILCHKILNFEDHTFVNLVEKMIGSLKNPLEDLGNSLVETTTKAKSITEEWKIQCDEFLEKRNEARKSIFQRYKEAVVRKWNGRSAGEKYLEAKFEKDLNQYDLTCQTINSEVQSLLNAIKYKTAADPSTSKENITMIMDLKKIVSIASHKTQNTVNTFEFHDHRLVQVPIIARFFLDCGLNFPPDIDPNEIKIAFSIENGKSRSSFLFRGDPIVIPLRRKEKYLDDFDIQNWNFDSCVVEIQCHSRNGQIEVLEKKTIPLREMKFAPQNEVVDNEIQFEICAISIGITSVSQELGWSQIPTYYVSLDLTESTDLRSRYNTIRTKIQNLVIPEKPESLINSPDTLVDNTREAFARDKAEILNMPSTRFLNGLAEQFQSFSNEIQLLREELQTLLFTAQSHSHEENFRKVWDQIKSFCDLKANSLCYRCDFLFAKIKELMILAKSAVIQRVLSSIETIEKTTNISVTQLCTRGMQSCFSRMPEIDLNVIKNILSDGIIKILHLATLLLCVMASNIRFDQDYSYFPSKEEIEFVYENVSQRVQSNFTQSKIILEKFRVSIDNILQFKLKRLDELRKARLLTQPLKKVTVSENSPLETIQLSKQASVLAISDKDIDLLITEITRIHAKTTTLQKQVSKVEMSYSLAHPIVSDCEGYRWIQTLDQIHIYLPSNIKNPIIQGTRTTLSIFYEDGRQFLHGTLFKPQVSNSIRYFEKDGSTRIILEKENKTEWWQSLFLEPTSTTEIIPRKELDANLIDEILTITVDLQTAGAEWALQFPILSNFAKTRKLYANPQLCPLSIELEITFIQSGIVLLRLIYSVKTLLSLSGHSKKLLMANNFAEKSTKDLRELLALIPTQNLPQSLQEAFHSVNIVPEEAFGQQMENAKLSELYNAERITRRNAESTKIQDVVIHRPKVQGHWTYQKLTECRSLQKMMNIVNEKLRSLLAHILENATQPVRFQILCLIDNSNSMAVFEHQMKETMVLVIEVLRRLECPFAIGRFAGKKVVDLLKDFETPFDMNLGEYILEKLNCAGKGTCPADAFKSFLEKLWPTNDASVQTHRIVLMVTDGLTTQVNASVYSDLCSQYRVTLNTMVLWDASRPRNIRREEIIFHNSLSAAHDQNVDVRIVEIYTRGANKDSNTLSFIFAGILESLFTKLRNQNQSVPNTSTSPFSYRLNSGIPLVMANPLLDMAHLSQRSDLDLKSLIQQSASSTVTSFYNVSSNKKVIPGASTIEDFVDNECDSRLMNLESIRKELGILIDSLHLTNAEANNRAELNWIFAENKMASEIIWLVQILEECVFPLNKYTRRKGDLRGSTLHIPGIIKAIATDFTYKKYFGSLTAGGKRRYSVVIAVDCSLSMQSFTAECVLQTLFLFVCALKRIGVEFSIITFGEKIRLLKDFSTEWSSIHSWILLSQLNFEDYSSLDADAINCGVDLLSSARGPKTLFILTDGYGTSGKRLPAALRRAHMESVEVIALAVGMDKYGVSHSYQSWVECALPRYVPDALAALYKAEEDQISTTNEGRKWHEFYLTTGNNLSIEQILAQHVPAFSEDLNTERNIELRIGNNSVTQDLSVDLCFVTDLTGSMSLYSAVVIEQICQIINGIQNAAKVQYPELEVSLRVAFVGFRDNDNSNYKDTTLKFTSDKTTATNYVKTQLTSVSGGGDLAEDINGGLAAALNLDWQSPSKALILITDAPGHGSEMNNGLVEDSKPGAPGPKPQIDKMIEKEINFFFCRIKKDATSRMEETFIRLYNNSDAEREMIVAPLITESDPSILPADVVYILCLDESLSMKGTPFARLQSAYNEFLNKVKSDQGANRRIAIINFAGSARWMCGPEPVFVNAAPPITPSHKGEANYSLPMQYIGEVLSRPSCSNSQFVVLFMTDGCGNEPGTLVQDYTKRLGSRFIMHSVGFGSGVDANMLITLTAGGGKYHSALNGQELVNVFHNIAADSNTANQLPKTIVNQIMDTAVTKLVLDYL